MSVSNSIKKAIAKDWINEFPDLLAYTQNKLYKVVGPFVTGIEIFNQPRAEDYRPYFVVYGLWGDNIKECLSDPGVLQEMKTIKGLQFDVPYTKHQVYFKEVIECTRDQVLMSFNKDISLANFVELINSRFKLDNTAKSSHVSQANLYVYKLYAALYVDDRDAIGCVLDEIKQASKKWLPQYFEWKYGKIETWYQNLQAIVNDRDDFLARVERNKSDTKLKKLNYSELIRF